MKNLMHKIKLFLTVSVITVLMLYTFPAEGAEHKTYINNCSTYVAKLLTPVEGFPSEIGGKRGCVNARVTTDLTQGVQVTYATRVGTCTAHIYMGSDHVMVDVTKQTGYITCGKTTTGTGIYGLDIWSK